jgi:hypothetical protein
MLTCDNRTILTAALTSGVLEVYTRTGNEQYRSANFGMYLLHQVSHSKCSCAQVLGGKIRKKHDWRRWTFPVPSIASILLLSLSSLTCHRFQPQEDPYATDKTPKYPGPVRAAVSPIIAKRTLSVSCGQFINKISGTIHRCITLAIGRRCIILPYTSPAPWMPRWEGKPGCWEACTLSTL